MGDAGMEPSENTSNLRKKFLASKFNEMVIDDPGFPLFFYCMTNFVYIDYNMTTFIRLGNIIENKQK